MAESDLTPTMQQALDAIRANPGNPARDYAGGISTVWALMRRGLCEVDQDKEHWHTFPPAHEHVFTTNLHMDGCHFYTTSASCECGAIYGFRGERSMTDPYSAVWMADEGQESCERCTELMNGARPVYETVIQRPRGYKPPLEVVA